MKKIFQFDDQRGNGMSTSAEKCQLYEDVREIAVRTPGLQAIDLQDVCTLAPTKLLIVLIDHKNLIRDCLARSLSSTYRGASVAAFMTVAEYTQADIDFTQVAFVLYNIYRRRPSDPEVEEGLCRLEKMGAAAPIILLSDSDDADRVVEALERGVRGYIPTGETIETTICAADLVSAGGTFVPASSLKSLTPSLEDPRPVSSLAGQFTHRQLAVLHLVRQGKANRTIAHELNMSESTVKAHVRNVMEKLKATNRTQIVYLTRELFSTTASAS